VFLYKKYSFNYAALYNYFAANYDIVEFDKSFAYMVSKVSYQNYLSFPVFFIFLSALIVAVRTDLQAMVIPQICTLWLVPFGFASSCFSLTNITASQSLEGAFFGYAFLWIIAFLFKKFTGKDGVGVGDMELLAMIGSFLGPIGVWVSLMLGSVFGLIVGGMYLFLFKKNRMTRIPFGPFLALGAIAYFFLDQKILQFLF
jgi:leader peptidase (prepilin peptidase)/N-methyltransferase